MPLTEDGIAKLSQLEIEDPILLLVTITHDELPQAIRLTTNTEPVTSRGETYVPAKIGARFFPQRPGEAPRAEFTFAPNDQVLQRALREIDEAPRMTLELVFASDPDTVQEAQEDIAFSHTEMGLVGVRAELAGPDLLSVQGPKLAFTPDIAPGVFR